LDQVIKISYSSDDMHQDRQIYTVLHN